MKKKNRWKVKGEAEIKFHLENSKYQLEDIEYCGEIRFVQALSSMLCVMLKCDLL